MLINYMFLFACVYGSMMFLIYLAKKYYVNDLKPSDSYEVPINRRTESRVAPTTKTLVANKAKTRKVDKKVRRKEVEVKQNKSVSYASYRENNIVKF